MAVIHANEVLAIEGGQIVGEYQPTIPTNIESMTRIAIGQKPGRRKVDNMEILVQMDRSALHLHPGVSSIQGREWTLLPCQPDIIRVPWRDCDAVVTIATMFTSQMNEIV